MPLLALDHVNIRTAALAPMREFYREVLGLREGPRPNFSFNGAWMYCGQRPVVHLVEVERAAPANPDLRVQHFAFSGSGLAELREKLEQRGVALRLGFVADFGLCQVNVFDPDGNHIHVDFPIAEADALGLR